MACQVLGDEEYVVGGLLQWQGFPRYGWCQVSDVGLPVPNWLFDLQGPRREYVENAPLRLFHLGVWGLIVGGMYGTHLGRTKVLPACLAINVAMYVWGVIHY
eukprot:m.56421 g.56421  ORF g.56421 m.56421 type:complete len:102 (+) comp13684_c1_seq2:901-1206(+)